MINNTCKKVILAVTMLGSLSLAPVMATSFSDVVPTNDWTYEAIRTLVKHGGLTDTKGINPDGSIAYTRGQLAPLMAYITDHREQMNDNDKETALKLYRAYKDEVMAYNVAETKRAKALKQQDQDHQALEKKLSKNRMKADKSAQAANKNKQASPDKNKKQVSSSDKGTVEVTPNQGSQGTAQAQGPAVMNDVYYGATNPPAELQPIAPPDAAEEVNYKNEKPEEVALTPEQIQAKMKRFKVDDSPLRVSGDVRLRTQGTQHGQSKSDGKANVEMAMTW